MPDRPTIDVRTKYLVQSIPIPRNTTTQTTTFVLGNVVLETLDVFYSPGHVGLVGVRVNYAGVTIVPWNQPTVFVVGSNERRLFDVGIPVGDQLSIVTRNLDARFAHTIVLTAAVTELELVQGAKPPALLPLVEAP